MELGLAAGPSVRESADDDPMILAELVCSDDRCELVLEAVGELRELEALVCDDCGCCLQVVAISDVELAQPLPPRELLLAA